MRIMDQNENNENSDVNGKVPVDPDHFKRQSNGRFGQGNKGRPVGIKDKTTNGMKQFLLDFCIEKAPDLYEAWDTLSAREKVDTFCKIAKMVMPNEQADEQKEIVITLKEAEK